MEGHGRSFPITRLTFQVRKVRGGVVVVGGLLDYIVSPIPFPLDFGFGTQIWDLDLGLDLGLTNNLYQGCIFCLCFIDLIQTLPSGYMFGWKSSDLNFIFGGLRGQSCGKERQAMNTPSSKQVPQGPVIAASHSKKLSSEVGPAAIPEKRAQVLVIGWNDYIKNWHFRLKKL